MHEVLHKYRASCDISTAMPPPATPKAPLTPTTSYSSFLEVPESNEEEEVGQGEKEDVRNDLPEEVGYSSRTPFQQQPSAHTTLSHSLSSLSYNSRGSSSSFLKSSMKVRSSYTSPSRDEDDEDEDHIPIRTEKWAWKTLPPPTIAPPRRRLLRLRGNTETDTVASESHTTEDIRASLTEEEDPTTKRRVSFSDISMREYTMTVGDNVTVYGAPVTLSWTYEARDTLSLDDYEFQRSGHRKRNMRQMHISAVRRKAILLRAGFSTDDIRAAKRASNRTRRQRYLTKQLLPLQPVQDFLQSAKRKWKRQFGRKEDSILSNTTASN